MTTSAPATAPAAHAGALTLRVASIDSVAEDIVLLRLRDRDGKQPSGWAPGGHLELVLPSSRIRHYSLCGLRSAGADTEFELGLAETGVTVTVPADRSALDVVHDLLPDHPCSCLGGQCGSREVAVLSGAVDHREEVLSDDERTANSAVMLCVSRARQARLVIQL